jgi:hypothetical protein
MPEMIIMLNLSDVQNIRMPEMIVTSSLSDVQFSYIAGPKLNKCSRFQAFCDQMPPQTKMHSEQRWSLAYLVCERAFWAKVGNSQPHRRVFLLNICGSHTLNNGSNEF